MMQQVRMCGRRRALRVRGHDFRTLNLSRRLALRVGRDGGYTNRRLHEGVMHFHRGFGCGCIGWREGVHRRRDLDATGWGWLEFECSWGAWYGREIDSDTLRRLRDRSSRERAIRKGHGRGVRILVGALLLLVPPFIA